MRRFQVLLMTVVIFSSFVFAGEENFLSGTWLAQGSDGKICKISTVDATKMKFVNEKGEVGYGSFETFQTIVVDFPSAKGLKGQILEGKRLNWSNGQFWIRSSNTGGLANTPVVGASGAKVTIVEYTNFQCPYCSKAHFTLKELLKQYQGKIKIAYKHYPFSHHVWSQDAAMASVCAYKQKPESFWKLTDYFFKNQQAITAETLSSRIKEFATRSNLNYSQLQTCIQDPSTKEKVLADIAEAEKLGLSAVPSFLVNGKIVEGALPIDQFQTVIDQALAEVQ